MFRQKPTARLLGDYRTLLADGVVGYTDERSLAHLDVDEWKRPRDAWSHALLRLAKSDGLKAGQAWVRDDDIAFEVCVELVTRSGKLLGGPNIYPYDQAAMAAWHRPRAEAEWGEALERARAKQHSRSA